MRPGILENGRPCSSLVATPRLYIITTEESRRFRTWSANLTAATKTETKRTSPRIKNSFRKSHSFDEKQILPHKGAPFCEYKLCSICSSAKNRESLPFDSAYTYPGTGVHFCTVCDCGCHAWSANTFSSQRKPPCPGGGGGTCQCWSRVC